MSKHVTKKDLMGDKVVFGLWIYILSDCVLFAALFATYAVQHTQLFGGPAPSGIFSLSNALVETLLLLTSSFTCGLAVLAAYADKKGLTMAALAATLLLGISFVALELVEFGQLLADGHSWQQSGFLSSFFTLVGTHGLHVSLGMLWMLVLLSNIALRGVTTGNMRKLLAFSIFWHFLDIIWIFIFTFVYLFGLM
jgi:cytochrome o ubiquinol oxidase subunit III